MYKMNPEKPQGFEIGKQRKRGIYYCFYNCGLSFYNEEEAKTHVPCSGRETLENTLAQMRALANKEKSVVRNVQVYSMDDNGCSTERANLNDSIPNPASATDVRHELYERFQSSALPSEPMEDPMARVAAYLIKTEFTNEF